MCGPRASKQVKKAQLVAGRCSVARHPAQSADAGPLLVTGASPALHQHGCCHLAPPFKLAASRGEEGWLVALTKTITKNKTE